VKASKTENWFQASFQQPKSGLQKSGINIPSSVVFMFKRICISRCVELVLLKVIESEGLEKYVDARYLRNEMSEAMGMTQDEMDYAAHQLMATTPASYANSAPPAHKR